MKNEESVRYNFMKSVRHSTHECGRNALDSKLPFYEQIRPWILIVLRREIVQQWMGIHIPTDSIFFPRNDRIFLVLGKFLSESVPRSTKSEGNSSWQRGKRSSWVWNGGIGAILAAATSCRSIQKNKKIPIVRAHLGTVSTELNAPSNFMHILGTLFFSRSSANTSSFRRVLRNRMLFAGFVGSTNPSFILYHVYHRNNDDSKINSSR